MRNTREERVAGVAQEIAAALGGSPEQHRAAAQRVVDHLEHRTPVRAEPPGDAIARVLAGEVDVLSHAHRAALEDAARRIIAYNNSIEPGT